MISKKQWRDKIMKNKLFRVRINTYYFGNKSYYLYVLADNEEEALEYVYKHESYRKDEDAEIDEIVQIAEETRGVV